MPSYSFKCRHCGATERRIMTPEEVKAVLICKCGYVLHRTPKPPTARITETLDNGLMPRAIERPADAEQLNDERAHGKKGVI